MGILSTILERRNLEQPSTPISSAALDALYGGMPTAASRTVTAETSMQVSAVYACVRVRAETVASLPWRVYRRLAGGGKAKAPEHPVYRLLHDAPNPEMTAIEMREALVGHLDLWGHAYCEIEWDGAGQVRALWPLRPDMVQEARQGRRLYWVVTLPDGSRRGLPAYRVWHTRGFMAASVIRYAREAVGLSLGAEEYGARLFANDSRPGGILTYPGKLQGEAAQKLKQSWEAAHSGLSNSHRVAVLEEGVTWQQIGMPPQDAQYMELRKFQRSEIAAFFRVPPHKIGDLERSTNNNIEHQAVEFVTDCIRPICVRLEQSALQALFTVGERDELFAEHVVDGLLRGDIKTRYEAYGLGRQWGWLAANDIRELENQNPLPDEQGNIYMMPANMLSADHAGRNGGQDDGEQGD